MLSEIAHFLLSTLATLLLLRAYMNFIGMPARNPLAHFAIALTDWMVQPLRRLLPAQGRFDTATFLGVFLLAFLVQLLLYLLRSPLSGHGVLWLTLFLGALLMVATWVLYLVLLLVFVHIVFSWVNPHAPVAPAIAMLVRPFLEPFQKILPPIRGIDLSPLLLILVVQVMLIVLSKAGG
jgi:YggT family protein